ncbi:chain-length determining protein [Lactobacillus allii] [Lactiplantibacillus mudanjiangensis]|uniref:YveK family protein n=1 Tax=Lactiplantibacillus mudanjiangensis TaxID=1296538 RepID=UPI0010149EAB|nr:chain-length determining protein [Lactobacillus allii] [Lactiplantibacillus mudanjiangensis]
MIKSIFHIILKRILLIAVTVIVFLVGSVAYVQFLSTPTYKATVQMIASDNVDQLSVYSNLLTNGDSFKKPISKIIQKKDSTITSNDVNTLTMSYTAGKPVFSISATSSNAKNAAEIANVGAAYFSSNIGKYMLGVNVGVLSKATVPTEPIAPRRFKMMMIAVVIGGLAGIALAFVKELFLDRTLDKDYLDNVMGFYDLGSFSIKSRDSREEK